MYDVIILGAGLYGLYSALYCAKKVASKKLAILVVEAEDHAFKRATYINQARVHMGYHYPRSLYTASKSAHYFSRFMSDFEFCIHTKFDQIYAVSTDFSWTDAKAFRTFCFNAGIKCEDVSVSKYFKNEMCSGAFLTEEYTYDAQILCDWFLEQLSAFPNIKITYNTHIKAIKREDSHFTLNTTNGEFSSPFLLNATYASVNEIIKMLGFDPLAIKYELCEIVLCNVSDELKNVGITVMDGPFFSIMPFGMTGLHSLTSVAFTPHETSKEDLPTFDCQNKQGALCHMHGMNLGNCNECPAKPKTAWHYMSSLARKYMKDELAFSFERSLYSMKPILKASEIDDSRPTVIKTFCTNPTFVCVLSGKINTVYDLDGVLDEILG